MSIAKGESFAELLRTFRSRARFSQQGLAKRAGLSARTLSDIERGVARPTRALTLSLIEQALELGAEDRTRLRSAARTFSESTAFSDAGGSNETSRLIGREEDLAALSGLLEGGVRMISLLGSAGVGKTALARNLVKRVATNFDEAIVVDLAPLPSADLVPAKVAVAADARQVRDGSRAEDVARAFLGRRVLLLLDNFEHVTKAASFVAELLTAAPSVVVIATSRVPLHVSLEHQYQVSPLRFTAGEEAGLDELERVPAVGFFLERVRETVPEFALNSFNRPAIVRIARELAGVPLAIELAAPLLERISPSELADRLEGGLPALVSERSDLPRRHRSMLDALSWSYDLLAPHAQRAFRRLAVLRAPFSIEAAHALLSEESETPDALSALRSIALLVEQSLLRVAGDDERTLFEFFPFVREYAESLQRDSSEVCAVLERLAQHCLAVGATVDLGDPKTHSVATLERVAVESPHVDVILTWCLQTERIELALRLALGMYAYWWIREVGVGFAWMRRLIEHVERAGPLLNETLVAEAYWRAGSLADQYAAHGLAEKFSEVAVARLRALGDEEGLAAHLSGAGCRASLAGNHVRAREMLTAAVEIRRRIGSSHRLAMSLCDLGSSATLAGDDAAASRYLEESLALFRAVGSDIGIGVALATLGLLAVRAGEPDRAEALSNQSLAAVTPLGNTATIAIATFNLAGAAVQRGNFERARALAHETIGHYEVIGRLAAAADVLDLLAAIAIAEGDAVRAARLVGAGRKTRMIEGQPEPAERFAHERLVAALIADLGSARFAEEAARGEAAAGLKPVPSALARSF